MPTPVEIVEALLLARFWSEAESTTTAQPDQAAAPAVSPLLSSPAPVPPPSSNAQPAAAPKTLQAGDAVLPSSTGTGSTAAVPFRSPRARALPGALKIAGALRPLRKRHASDRRVEMDEAATLQQIADGGPRAIVWRQRQERWLSVELVLDESLSMHVWRPTLRELRRLLEQHGAFNGVNVWQLNADEPSPQLWRKRGGQRQLTSATKVLNQNRRQLVIVVSDCTAAAWHHGGAYQWLVDWARRAPTVLAQVLPRALWLDTSMIETDVWLSATQAGVPNAALRVNAADDGEDYADWLRKGAPLPVITLDEWSIAPWAKMVAGVSPAPVIGFVLPDMTDLLGQPLPPVERLEPENAAARVKAFATASPMARELARLLAAVPLSLPVMQLVQQTCKAQSRQSHLAEIFRSDLLDLPEPKRDEPFNDEKIFDFHEGVRDELLSELSERQQQKDAEAVLEAVEKFIAEHTGQSGVFGGLIVLPDDATHPDAVNVDPLALAFARIGAHTLRKLDVQLDKAERWEAFVQRYDAPPIVTPQPSKAAADLRTVEDFISVQLGAAAMNESRRQARETELRELEQRLKNANFLQRRSLKQQVETARAELQQLIENIAGQYAALNERLRSQLALHKQHGYRLGLAVIQQWLSRVSHSQGEISQALSQAQTALTLYDELGETERADLMSGFIEQWESELSPFKLTPFEFDTVTLDQHGKVNERRSLAANQFIETLAPGLTLEMVEIPGGTFTMGSPKSEKDSYDDERPQHEVTVSPFFLGKFTITQAQWREVASWPQVERELEAEPSHFPKDKRRKESDDQRPVEQISWEDAQEFCARLSAQTGRAYRLPTEAEWEMACRAGTTTPFAFGPTITPEFVNYDGNYPYDKAPKGTDRRETIPVGSLGVANGFGLYDMHGNVWEWCQDWFADDYYQQCEKQGTVIDPTGPEKGQYRALRGGSWNYNGWNCRSPNRYSNLPGDFNYYFGFRVVVSARTP